MFVISIVVSPTSVPIRNLMNCGPFLWIEKAFPPLTGGSGRGQRGREGRDAGDQGSLSRESKQESQPRSGVSLRREKRKRKKHFGRGIHQRILAAGGQGPSRLGGLERDEKPRQL